MDLGRFEIGWDGCVFGEMDGKEKKKEEKKCGHCSISVSLLVFCTAFLLFSNFHFAKSSGEEGSSKKSDATVANQSA